MATSSRAAAPAAGLAVVPALLGLVRFKHTVFALPFAFAGALLAQHGVPPAATLGWILLAMVGARSLAMALNRLIDAPIDALNPRTAARELPSGRLTRGQVLVFCAASLAALLVAVSRLPWPTWFLWPIPVAMFVLYPYAKRVTWGCHLVLGLTIGLAPVGAWLAVTGGIAGRRRAAGAGRGLLDRRLRHHLRAARRGLRPRPRHPLGARALRARARPLAHPGACTWRPSGCWPGPASPPAAGRSTSSASRAARWCCCTRTRSSPRGTPGAWPRAFGTANGILSLAYAAFVLAEVTLS